MDIAKSITYKINTKPVTFRIKQDTLVNGKAITQKLIEEVKILKEINSTTEEHKKKIDEIITILGQLKQEIDQNKVKQSDLEVMYSNISKLIPSEEVKRASQDIQGLYKSMSDLKTSLEIQIRNYKSGKGIIIQNDTISALVDGETIVYTDSGQLKVKDKVTKDDLKRLDTRISKIVGKSFPSGGGGGESTGGTTNPGGANTQVQFNDLGGFGADATFTFNKATKQLTNNLAGLNTSYTPTGSEPIGSSYRDSANRTFSDVLPNGVIGQRYQELFIDGQNNTGVTIPNGTPVAYDSAIGNSGNFRIKLAQASASEPAYINIGITTEGILDGTSGKITTTGKVRGIQTNGANYGEVWADGEILYISGTTAGALTNVAPNAPTPAIPVALVISAHATNGTLEVRPTFPSSLKMLTDVDGADPTTTGDLLTYNQLSGTWERGVYNAQAIDDNAFFYALAFG